MHQKREDPLNAEERLREVEEANDELMRESQRQVQDNETLQQQLAGLTADHDQLVGRHEELKGEVERLKDQLKQSRGAAEAARVELAKEKLRADAEQKHADQIYQEFTSLGKNFESQRKQHVESERALAGAEAARETLRARVEELMQRSAAVISERDKLQTALDQERTRRTDAERDGAASQAEMAEMAAANKQAADLLKREESLQTELKALRTPAAPGKGRREE